MKDWPSMTDRERDAQMAEALGMHVEWNDGEPCEPSYKGFRGDPIPPYTTSLDAMRLVEGVIEERGLGWEYTQALCRVCKVQVHEMEYEVDDHMVGPEGQYIKDDDAFRLLRATPAQRAEAAWRVLRRVDHVG